MLVVLVSPNKFPNGDAGAIRDLSFAKLYQRAGLTPLVLCQNGEKEHGIYEGIRFISLRVATHSKFGRAINHISYAGKLKAKLLEILCYEEIRIIHLYDAPTNTVLMIKMFAKQYSIKLIHDSVEWYSACNFKLGYLDKSYIMKNILNRWLIDDNFSVIAISSYLENHFKKKCELVKRIPVIIDVEKMPRSFGNKQDTVSIAYAGSPGLKDHLKTILAGFMLMTKENLIKFELIVIGVTQEEAINLGMITEEACQRAGKSLKFYGRVSRECVIEILQFVNYTILIRPNKERYTKAGFPTKVVESLSMGIPVICNDSSDLSLYLVDGENSIHVQNDTPEAVYIAINKTLMLNRREWSLMSNSSRQAALLHFNYLKYEDVIKELIK